MTKFHLPSFNSPANSKKYRDNWDSVFGPKKEKAPEEQEPVVDKERICEMCGKETAMFYKKAKDVYLDLCADCAGEKEE